MDVEYSTLSVEPARLRVKRGTIQRLLDEPVEVVDEVVVEGGLEVVLRCPNNALRAVVADSDAGSLAVVASLPRADADPAEVAAIKSRIAVAALPKNPAFERFSDEQRRQQAGLERYRREVRTNAIAAAVFMVVAVVIVALTR
jgi:hypothetical protein